MMRTPHPTAALLAFAARRWPAEMRDEEHRAWLAELHAIATDPDAGSWARRWRALYFSLSLAVRRPAPSALPVAPIVATARPAVQLFGAGVAVTLFGTLAALLVVHLPAAVADRLPHPDGADVAHRLPLLALVPTLAAIGVLVGRRMARRDAPRDVPRTVAIIAVGLCCARLFPVFGDVVTALPGIVVWAAGLCVVAGFAARLAHRPRGPLPWVALGLGALALADLAVTVSVWLSLDAGAAPRAYALSWFPGVLLDPAALVPMGTNALGDPVNTIVVDAAEFLPHALIVITAFTLAYVHTAAARAAGRETTRVA